MVAISNVLLFVAAAAATVLPRDAATIKKDFTTINNDTVTLTTATNAYTGGAINSVPIQNAYKQLDTDVKSATTDAKASAVVSDTDAQSIIDYINNTLEPNIVKAITALSNKKSQLKADGLSATVLTDLKTLKNDTDTLGAALITKTSTAKQTNAKSALSKIDTDLQNGINTFSS